MQFQMAQMEKIQTHYVNDADRDLLAADQHIFTIADYFKISPQEVEMWDKDRLNQATSYVAIATKPTSNK